MKKQLLVCDQCGNEVDSDGGVLRFNYTDGRRGSKVADLCGVCANNLPGSPTARRGRPKKEAQE
jgi:hypothetical protein